MIKLFLKTIDMFLYQRVSLVFRKTEAKLLKDVSKKRLLKELASFEEHPLRCIIATQSTFEKKLKMKLKFHLGICFVFFPLLYFSSYCYLTGTDILFALFITLLLTLFVASRMETIAQKYVNFRKQTL